MLCKHAQHHVQPQPRRLQRGCGAARPQMQIMDAKALRELFIDRILYIQLCHVKADSVKSHEQGLAFSREVVREKMDIPHD